MGTPYASGKNWDVAFTQSDKKVLVRVKTWKVGREGVMAEDGVNGDDRNENQFITTGFSFEMELFVRDAKIILATFPSQEAEDSQTLPPDQQIGLSMKPNNGTRAGFALRDVTLGAWDLNSAGMTDRSMIKLPFKAKYFDPVAVVTL